MEWSGYNEADFVQKTLTVGILHEPNEDLRSLKELTMYGLKGMAAYLEHAMRLGHHDCGTVVFIQRTLADITLGLSVDEWVARVIETGEYGVRVMALLDTANTSTFGHPELTSVNIGAGKNLGILSSGHDLKDLEDMLKQTKGTGVDVYTHSEMLPGHYYPAFKRYKHFVGNYGNAW